MVKRLPSLPLHPGARQYYEEYFRKKGYLAPKPAFQDTVFGWVTYLLNNTWKFLATILILLGAYKGLLTFRRDRTSNEVGRRILAVDVETSEPYSVTKLSELRREIRERVKRRW